MNTDTLTTFLASLRQWFEHVWRFEIFRSGSSGVSVSQIVIAFLVVLFGLILNRRLSHAVERRILSRTRLNENTTHLLQKIFSSIFMAIIVLVALPIAGIPITIFTVLGGALAIGVGFGAQNLFNNLISGLIIMIEKPIRIGDIVVVGDSEGKIAAIGNRCVRIRRGDGVDVLVPNSHFLEQPVINWTLFDSDLRGTLSVGVAYGSPTATVRDLLLQAADEHQKVHRTPTPYILFKDFGDNALTFNLYFWSAVSAPMDLERVTSDLRFRVDELFREQDITISFPQRDVHLDTLQPLEIRMRD